MRQKHEKLIEAYKEKSKSQQQTQRMYQALKQQQFAAGMELAADNDAGHVLQDNAGGRHTELGSEMQSRHYHQDQPRARAGGAGDPWPTMSKVGANRYGVESSRKCIEIQGENAC